MPSGEFVQVADGDTTLKMSIQWFGAANTPNELTSRIIVYVPRGWLDFFKGKDPCLQLGRKIRTILEEHAIGGVQFEDLT